MSEGKLRRQQRKIYKEMQAKLFTYWDNFIDRNMPISPLSSACSNLNGRDVTSQETATGSDPNNKHRSKGRKRTEKKNKGKKRKGKRRLRIEKKKLKLEQDKKRIESEIDKVKMELKSTAHSQGKNTDKKRHKGKLSKSDRLQNGIFNLQEKKLQIELKLVKLKKNELYSNYKKRGSV